MNACNIILEYRCLLLNGRGNMRPKSDTMVSVQELQKLEMLQWVDIVAVHGLLQNCPVESLSKGDTLLETGGTNRTMFMVLEGRFGVYLDPQCQECIAELHVGETIGELSVIDDRPASATVKALDASRVLAVNEDTFWLLVAASHAFAVNLLMLLSRRMRATNLSVSKNIQLRRRFEQEAKIDTLTGLHNRRWLDDNLSRIIERHLMAAQPLAVLMVDVDDFKVFNDSNGHQAGDAALSRIGRILAANLRPTDLIARFGGEEFVVVLPLTDSSGAHAAAERVRHAVSAEAAGLPDGSVLTVSLGIAQLLGNESSDTLLARADSALYRAKAGGKNRCELG